MKKVFILGQTGFLGYYTALELNKRHYQVSGISLPPAVADSLFPEEIEELYGDLNQYTDEEIIKLLDGVYAFIYAAGADERIVPDAPAVKFFYEANVLPTQRLARLARQAGVKKFVLFGSYFAHFAEKWTDLNLKTHHAYPRTRLLQEEIAIMESHGQMDVMTLRLPYIFGTMPGRTPLWTMMVDRVRDQDSVPVLPGGTAMVTAQQVAQAAVGAIEFGQHQGKYAICDTNMKHTEFFQMIADELGQTNTKIVEVPLEAMKPAMEQHNAQVMSAGKEHGIHLDVTAVIQSRDAYLDPEDTMPILKYEKDDIYASIRETLNHCVQVR
ncbi:NAD-dependent epimerase/dehydratase family protein [Paenibacillus urinalis]|uniref:NAD-dependent epimerase/dehydratase family protein n=1 Tax=Paenibacillus urinalis TaxID=521520 RepID=A0AAX3MW30_9BACL|nr:MULTISPECIES: NAD-dependent epimerase/dehydratase family protein [Paenibacillus]WDH80617.1 NAD-dependent epimerase/dehydratase family protein [Paenibacillus urinalis]WDH96669.1 NAD-dependent epimerase/dehydratase family protein [Paenibacillus urinalis]WDI00313.1 NAD-dependent epimerase/dehydratase family protein [Paenibacillus urinalis]GAK40823.1 hypothetical protein TCA2_3313 [Paenibacillus sp. TCA20]